MHKVTLPGLLAIIIAISLLIGCSDTTSSVTQMPDKTREIVYATAKELPSIH